MEEAHRGTGQFPLELLIYIECELQKPEVWENWVLDSQESPSKTETYL